MLLRVLVLDQSVLTARAVDSDAPTGMARYVTNAERTLQNFES